MISSTDYDKLQQLMAESPENRQLLTRLLESHRMEISAISHEIRNPLTLVYSTFQLIESQHPEVKSFSHWNDMHQDLNYMTQLLEELSLYNNSERLQLSTVNLEDFLKRLALHFASSLVDTEIEFTSQIEPGLPCLSLDQVKFRQVLQNLFANAKDALNSNSNRMSGRISLVARTSGDSSSVQIEIRDNGCGMSPEQLTHIFEPFTTYKPNGTGLGLALCQRIVDSHGGTIQVASELGRGTAFILTLPIEPDC